MHWFKANNVTDVYVSTDTVGWLCDNVPAGFVHKYEPAAPHSIYLLRDRSGVPQNCAK